jgi:glycosyltransferase involved in cell wall biosynthesis
MGSLSTDRTRVLMLLDQLVSGGGGAEVFTTGLATTLPRDRFDVRVCATREAEGFLVEMLDEAGIPWFCLERRGRDPRPLREVYRYLRQNRIEVLHSHMFGSNVWGTTLGRLARVPVLIAQEHSWSYEGQLVRRLLDRHLIGRFASRFVAVTENDRRRMIEIEGVRPEKTVVIPAALVRRNSAGGSADGSRDVRAELGIPLDAPVVGTVASMRPPKALHVLVDAFVELLKTMPEARLLMVGDGPSRQGVEAHARSRGLAEDRAIFTGQRPDVDRLIDAFDVSALSSVSEGTPLFIFESMARGRPVVSTRVGGVPEVIDDGQSGVLVPPEDPQALARTLEALLRDPARREAIAAGGRERLREFTPERAAERFAALYEELLP